MFLGGFLQSIKDVSSTEVLEIDQDFKINYCILLNRGAVCANLLRS